MGTANSPRQRRGPTTHIPVHSILEARSGGERNADGARNRISPPRAPDKIAPRRNRVRRCSLRQRRLSLSAQFLVRPPAASTMFRLRLRQPRGAGTPSKLRICGTIVLRSHGAAPWAIGFYPSGIRNIFPTEWEQPIAHGAALWGRSFFTYIFIICHRKG